MAACRQRMQAVLPNDLSLAFVLMGEARGRLPSDDQGECRRGACEGRVEGKRWVPGWRSLGIVRGRLRQEARVWMSVGIYVNTRTVGYPATAKESAEEVHVRAELKASGGCRGGVA
ncbi:hypothetical protein EPH_0042560 [Eimeria praecox]|uniref:Uncharacterized protein n=1 Tax=Eimeria praecox TaxID=51316 RepID=U6GAM1_9EIME|nr:hypothetical protein EPH_0042560 [Eimeria praecox]